MDIASAPGWLGRFVKWNSSNNGFPLVWHLMGALVALGSATARRVYVRYDSKPIYLMQSVVLVGRSGLGKGWIMSETRSLLREALGDNVNIISGAPTPESLTSPTLIKLLDDGVTMACPTVLLLDEFSTALSKRDYMKAMAPRLTTILQNDDEFEDPRTQERRVLRDLMFMMFGGSTEDFLESQLDPDALGAGLESRALWSVAFKKERFVGGTPGPNSLEDREGLIETLRGIATRTGELRVEDNAMPLLLDIQQECHEKEEAEPRTSGHYSRKPRTILRLAGLGACGNDEGTVTRAMLEWSAGLTETLEAPMFEMFERVASSSSERLNLYILKRLRDSGGAATHGQLFHDCRYKIGTVKQFQECIDALLLSRRIELDNSKRVPVYRLKESR